MTRREWLQLMAAGVVSAPSIAVGQRGDLTSLTVAAALDLLRRGTITPLQLTNAYLTRIQKLNPELNAYVTLTADLARREARNAKGPLAGIPLAHKDLLETRGIRTTAGSRLFDEYVPQQNAELVQRLEDAGAVLLGKTNTHELGGGVTTINPFFGTTRNPVDRTRIPGGSSGGSAAAVVAQLCAAATGSDTGGSIRIPAAFCGCVGFKPTHGALSTRGLLGASPTFDHVGFLTRTVEDASILWNATRTIPARSASPASGASPASSASPVRIGVPTNAYFFDKIWLQPEVESAFTKAVAQMGARGARIVSTSLPIDDKTMSRVFDPVFMFELWHRFGADWRTNPGSFSKEFATVFSLERPTVTEYETAQAALEEYRAAMDDVFNAVDIIVTPTVNMTAPLISGPIEGMRILRNTWPFNAAGTPAISVPVVREPLPIGAQLIARRGDDDKLLQLARTLAP